MPSSAKPRKKYRPKPILADPVGYVVEGVQLEVITVADMQKAIALGKREIKAKRATIIKETA